MKILMIVLVTIIVSNGTFYLSAYSESSQLMTHNMGGMMGQYVLDYHFGQ